MNRAQVLVVGAVALGGVIGTGLRVGLDELVPHTAQQFPVSTLVTNLVGTLVLAFLVADVWRRDVPDWVRALIGPGVLGTYTTFSAIVLAVVTISDGGRTPLAVTYLVVSLVLGLAAAVVGFTVGHRRRGAREREVFE